MKEAQTGFRKISDLVEGEARGLREAGKDLLATYAILSHLKIHSLKPNGRDFILRYVAKSIFEQRRRSAIIDARHILGEYENHILGNENIPEFGPIIFTANHWGQGPLIGHWASLLINEQASQKREDGQEVYWIKQNSLHIPGTNVEVPFSRQANKVISKVYPIILVEDPFDRAGKNGNAKITGLLEIFRVIKSGGMIGLYPEAIVSTVLRKGHPKAGFIAQGLARRRPDAMICPVGEWTTRKGSVLHLNIGVPFTAAEVLEVAEVVEKTERDQVVADYLMDKIKPLVPESLRGVSEEYSLVKNNGSGVWGS